MVAVALTLLSSGPARSQSVPTYVPHAWKDCSAVDCRPAEVLNYLLWSRESDKIIYADEQVPSALTVTFDVVGRTLLNGAEFRNVEFLAQQQGNFESQPFLFEKSRVNLLLDTFGVKARIAQRWLTTANVLFRRSDTGVTPHPTMIVGIERAFIRAPKDKRLP